MKKESCSDSQILPKVSEVANCILSAKGNTLFIIGAGASAEAGVPPSKDLKNQLMPGFTEEELRKILEQNGIVIPFTSMPLEAYLSAYQEILGHDWDMFSFLEPQLPTVYDDPPKKYKKPSLSYALLAHLMHHGLTRNLISLNFDELLEQALNEEVGPLGYAKVASRSAFGRFLDYNLIEEDQKYIFKPHGTISYPMTLRGTWESVKKLDNEKFQVLKEVLQKCKVWIFVGYGFCDLDITPLFLHVAHRYMQKDPEWNVWFVNRNPDILTNNNRIKALLSMAPNAKAPEDHFITMNSERFFRKVTEDIFVPKSKNSDAMLYHRKGYSHRIKDLLFQAGLEPLKENRLLLDIIFWSLITKGKFTENSLIQYPKVSNFIERFQCTTKDISNLIKNKLDNILKTEDIHGEVIYYLMGNKESDIIENIIVKLERIFNSIKIKDTHRTKIAEFMSALFEEYDISIPANPKPPFFFQSEKTKLITSLSEFRKITNDLMISNPKKLRIIAETGEWIRKYDLMGKNVKIIISDPRNDLENSYHKIRASKIINELFKSQVDVYSIFFPYNIHHITLFDDLMQGIYFLRRGKTPFITPVKISGGDFDRFSKYFGEVTEQAIRIDPQNFAYVVSGL